MIFFRPLVIVAIIAVCTIHTAKSQDSLLTKDWFLLEAQDMFDQEMGDLDALNDGSMLMFSPNGTFTNALDHIPLRQGVWSANWTTDILSLVSEDSTGSQQLDLKIMVIEEQELKIMATLDHLRPIFHMKALGKHETRCDMKPLSGDCQGDFHYYYFDHVTQQCEEFFHGGCGGVIPFKSLEECQQACHCEEH